MLSILLLTGLIVASVTSPFGCCVPTLKLQRKSKAYRRRCIEEALMA